MGFGYCWLACRPPSDRYIRKHFEDTSGSLLAENAVGAAPRSVAIEVSKAATDKYLLTES
jgi:hypothetical protein